MVVTLAALALPAVGQETVPLAHQGSAPAPLLKPKGAKAGFVLDVVRSAVAVPQPDDRDHLRVLSEATQVARLADPRLARQLAHQGAQLEGAMIARGETPELSLFGTGLVDCPTIAQFVQSLPANAADRAQDQLSGAVQFCGKQLTEPVQMKLTQALDNGVIAPRPILQLADAAGPNSRWAQATFNKLFSSLPSDTKNGGTLAGDLAQVFTRLAPEVDRDAAQKAGLSFLDWLGKLDAGSERDAAISTVAETLKKSLGDEAYNRALEEDPMARQAAQLGANGPGEAPGTPAGDPEAELNAKLGTDDLAALAKLPAKERARAAAAHGFDAGTGGDRNLADRYFDVAYDALNEVWTDGSGEAAAVVSEVNDAAAQVNAVVALRRAQALRDAGAQAIGMISVARVVASHDSSSQAEESPSARPGAVPRRHR